MARDRAVVAAGAATGDRRLALPQLGDERRHRVVVGANLVAGGIETAPEDGHARDDRSEPARRQGTSSRRAEPSPVGDHRVDDACRLRRAGFTRLRSGPSAADRGGQEVRPAVSRVTRRRPVASDADRERGHRADGEPSHRCPGCRIPGPARRRTPGTRGRTGRELRATPSRGRRTARRLPATAARP